MCWLKSSCNGLNLRNNSNAESPWTSVVTRFVEVVGVVMPICLAPGAPTSQVVLLRVDSQYVE